MRRIIEQIEIAQQQNRDKYVYFEGYDEQMDIPDVIVELMDFNPDTSLLGVHKPIIEFLQHINEVYGLDIGLTNTFRFSPGYLVKIRKAMMEKAFTRFNKRTKLHLLLEYNQWGFNNFKRDLLKLQDDITGLRNAKITMKDAIDDGAEAYNSFIEKFLSSDITEYAYDFFICHSPAGVGNRHYRYHNRWNNHSGDRNPRGRPYLVVVFKLEDIIINTFSREGHKLLAQIPYGDMYVQFEYNLYDWINAVNSHVPASRSNNRNSHVILGSWVNTKPNFKTLTHPYVHRDSTYGVGNVCYGNYNDDMFTAFHTMNWDVLVQQLNLWAGSYVLGLTGPLNNISLTQIGLKDTYFSKLRNPEECKDDALVKMPPSEHTCQMLYHSEHYQSESEQFVEDHCSSCAIKPSCTLYNEELDPNGTDRFTVLMQSLLNADELEAWSHELFTNDSGRYFMGVRVRKIMRGSVPYLEDNRLVSYDIAVRYIDKFNFIAALYEVMEGDYRNTYNSYRPVHSQEMHEFAHHFGNSDNSNLSRLLADVRERKTEVIRQQQALADLENNQPEPDVAPELTPEQLEELNNNYTELATRENL